MPGPVRRSAFEVLRDAAVRLFLATAGPIAASTLAIECGKPRVTRITAPVTDRGWSTVYPSAAGTIGRAHADQPDGEQLSGRESDHWRSFTRGVLIGYKAHAT
jgi:hypothetical protein